ncbi:hypothetical protein EJE08_17115 [Vibrio cholerae]|nr:hypothetical protein [Vibrio cholerae]
MTHVGNGDDYTGAWGKANVITKVGHGQNVVLAKRGGLGWGIWRLRMLILCIFCLAWCEIPPPVLPPRRRRGKIDAREWRGGV